MALMTVRDPLQVECSASINGAAVVQWSLLLENYRLNQPLPRSQGLMMLVE